MSRLYGAGSGCHLLKAVCSKLVNQLVLVTWNRFPSTSVNHYRHHTKIFPQEMFTNPQYDHVTLGIILLLPRYLGH